MQAISSAVFLLFLIIAAVRTESARAQTQDTTWKGFPDVELDWFGTENWTSGVPDATSRAAMINGGVARIESGQAAAHSLHLLGPWQNVVAQNGGELSVVGRMFIGSGEYRLSGGEFSAAEVRIGAKFGELLEWFPIDTTGVPMPDGYECDGERLCIPPDVLLVQNLRWLVSGGAADVAGELSVGQGHLVVSGGNVTADRLLIDRGGFSPRSFEAPEVEQIGGRLALDGALSVQDGLFELSDGELEVGRFEMGSLIPTIAFGPSRTPEFVQSGGRIRVDHNFEMCIPGFILPFPTTPPFTSVTFTQEAGRLEIGGDATVGSLALTAVVFDQRAGVTTVAGTMRIEGTPSRVQVWAGLLDVGGLEVGTPPPAKPVTTIDNTPTGSLALNTADARVVVHDYVRFWEFAEVIAAPGSSITLETARFDIRWSDPVRMPLLENLEVLVDGQESNGDGTPADVVLEDPASEWSRLEAASRDLGPSVDAFENNLRIGSLHVGASGPAKLLIVNDYPNHANPELDGIIANAVYVDELIVGTGSTLDLGGLNLYYRHAKIDGTILSSGGGNLTAVVPEPAACGLAAIAIVIVSGRRRRRRGIALR